MCSYFVDRDIDRDIEIFNFLLGLVSCFTLYFQFFHGFKVLSQSSYLQVSELSIYLLWSSNYLVAVLSRVNSSNTFVKIFCSLIIAVRIAHHVWCTSLLLHILLVISMPCLFSTRGPWSGLSNWQSVVNLSWDCKSK